MNEPVDPLKYATDYHAPVLCNTVVEVLITDPAGTYIDCTLGGGGHTHALLDALAPKAIVVGMDRDPEAIAAATRRLIGEKEAGRFIPVLSNFTDIEPVAEKLRLESVDGILLDFGISSHQIDDPARGFSHRLQGDLDMRMGQEADIQAAQIVNEWPEKELGRLLREYGEEKKARMLSRAIVAARPIGGTVELANIIRERVRGPNVNKVLARVFQALRIQVNDELDAIRNVLPAATRLVKEGGRCVAMSYHSLEDRLVKRYFRTGNFEGNPKKDFYGNVIAPWRPLTNRPITATDDEVKANPRARSVKLRAAERAPQTD